MAAPRITITAQSRRDKIITVFGFVTGISGGTVTAALPAAATPNGAVSRAAVPVALNPVGEFEHAFTALPYGDYDKAVITATNSSGTTTATGVAMKLFAPGTAPIGTPAVLFPDRTIPAFSTQSVALGDELTTFVLESTSVTAQTNVPFTFGQPIEDGDLAPGDFLVGKVVGSPDIPLQFNVKTTHANGSVRHAVISGVMPALAAGASKTVSIVRSSTGASTVAVPSASIPAAGFSASVSITTGGVAYTADATAALTAGMAAGAAWLAGSIATDYIVNLPFKTAAGAEHPDLMAQFSVRYYPGTAKAKVDVAVEHIKAYTAINDISYSGTVKIGGASVLTIAAYAGGDLVHAAGTRWKRTFWWNNPAPAHVRHNVGYLIGSRQVSNYKQDLVIPESVLADYETKMQSSAFHLLGNGLFTKVFGGTGGRPELALASAWYVTYLLSQDKRAKKLMFALAECAGSWNTHRRDTSTGPAAGQPLDIAHYPRATMLGTSADSKNTATGQTEKIPSRVSSSDFGADTSHQSAFAYIPYLVSGDFYYLEELHFWVNYCLYLANPGSLYRNSERGDVKSDQLRGQSWTMRTLAHAAAATPDDHPAKPRFGFWLQNNLAYFNATYTDNPDANKLGIIVNGATVVYDEGGAVDNGIGNFQDDFFMQTIGMIAELGFDSARRLALWKAKYQVSRINGPGYCFSDAAVYSPMVRLTNASPFFTTMAEVAEHSLPAELLALPCGSQARYDYMNATRSLPSQPYLVGDLTGYPYSTEGFPANLQPALAYAVDVGYPNADLAWAQFDFRPTKPAYETGPQFAIVPRGYVAPAPDPTPDPPPPPDPTPTPDPQPIETNNMAIADSVKDSTTSTGTGAMTLDRLPPLNYQAWSPAIPLNVRTPYVIRHSTLAQRESGFGHLSSDSVFVRDEVTSSTNNGLLVNFSAGVKYISCDLTAAFVEEMAGKHNLTVNALYGAPQDTLLMMEVNGEMQKIALSDAGRNVQEMALLTNPAGSDEFLANRGGVDGKFTFSAICAAVQAYLGAQGPADTAAPQLSSAQVANATPTVILLTFNETLGPFTPTASAFSVSGGKSVTAVSRNGATLSLTVSAAYAYNDAISVTYTKPATNPVQDMTGNQTPSFGPFGGTNYIAAPGDTVAPTVTAAAVANSAPTVVVLTASEPMDAAYTPAASAFTVAGHTVSSVAISGSSINLTVTPAFTNGEAARTVAYTQPGTSNARDLAGNLLATFTGRAITNNVAPAATAPGAPTIGTATAGDGSITVSFAAPASDGGAAIIAYPVSVYKVSDNSLVATGSGATSPVTVTSIPNGTQVYAKVAATNSVSTGPQSAASNSVTPVSSTVAYTITGYNSNAVRSTLDGSTANASFDYPNLRGFATSKTCTLSGYWNIKKTVGNTDPASAISGWGTSSTVPPAVVTTAENKTNGASSINGMIAMSHPAAFTDNSLLWVSTTPGTYPFFLWVKPVDGVAQCVNPKDGNGNFIPLTVTVV